MNVLDLVINIISKEVREENENCCQVLLTMLSAWTNNPQNLRILAPSGEGKTYLVTKIASYFPSENIIILQNATPQSFKYHISKKVVEISPDKFEDLQVIIDDIDEADSKKKKIKELQDRTYDLVDFRNKILIFVDAQSFQLWESLKAVLSHDQKTLKSISVNKSRSGTIQAQKIMSIGHPAVIYCSAKDEQSLDHTDEINTRFNTISLNTNSKKYRQMLELAAFKASVPECIYEEDVVSTDEIQKARQLIIGMITNAEQLFTINPFADLIQRQFADDAGYKTRQLNILLNNISLHTLANAKYRPKFIYKNTISIIATIGDVNEASKLTKRPSLIPPAKIQFFNRIIRSAIINTGKPRDLLEGQIKCLTASELAEYAISKGITTDRKKLQETYLKPSVDHGYLEEIQDPSNRNRNLYSLSTKYFNNEASLESTLIDNIDIDQSLVKSFVDRILTSRLENGKLEDASGMRISPEQLLDIILNRRTEPAFRHETSLVDMSTNIEGGNYEHIL